MELCRDEISDWALLNRSWSRSTRLLCLLRSASIACITRSKCWYPSPARKYHEKRITIPIFLVLILEQNGQTFFYLVTVSFPVASDIPNLTSWFQLRKQIIKFCKMWRKAKPKSYNECMNKKGVIRCLYMYLALASIIVQFQNSPQGATCRAWHTGIQQHPEIQRWRRLGLNMTHLFICTEHPCGCIVTLWSILQNTWVGEESINLVAG